MNKTLLIILGIAVAIGLVVFFFAPQDRSTIVTPVDVPSTTPVVALPSEPAPSTPAATAAQPEPSATTGETTQPAPSTTPTATPPSTAEAETATPSPESVVAVVNGTPITRAALDQGVASIVSQYSSLYAQMGQDFESMLVGADGFSMRLGIEAQALDRLAFDAIADAEVARRSLVVTDEELDTTFNERYNAFLQSNNLTEETLAPLLAAQGMTLESFKETGRDNIRESLLMMKLQVAVAGPVELTLEEIESYWERNRETYSTEEQIRASHILVKTEDEAKAILAELDGGADFATLAKDKSLDTASGKNGGDLGFFSSGTMVPEFEDAAFGLEVGQRSGAVQTTYGYHIILVTDKKAATEPELADVRTQVEADAREEIINERSNTWYTEVMAAADIVVNDPVLYAARQQKINADLGLAAFEKVRDSGAVDEPYVSYVIGTLYESRVQNLTRAKAQLEAASPQDTTKIAETALQIEDARAKALAAYQEALAQVGSDEAIQARIEAVQSASSTASGMAPQ